MNKQMTSAEIEFGMSVKERFTGLDKFDTLLGPNEGPYAPCPGIGAWAAPRSRARHRGSNKKLPPVLSPVAEVGRTQSVIRHCGIKIHFTTGALVAVPLRSYHNALLSGFLKP